MNPTTEAPDDVNPFSARRPAPPPSEDDVQAEDEGDNGAPPPPAEPDAEKERKRVEFAAKMAAGRALARERKLKAKAEAEKVTPDKPVAETERLRQKLTNFLPDNTTLEVWKRIDGKLVWVGNYDARDTQSSENVRRFIHKHLYKKHRAIEWEVVFVSADGKERAPHIVNMDPDAIGKEDPVTQRVVETLDEIKKEQNGRPSQMKEAIEGLVQLRELAGGDAQQPLGMVEYMMLRDMSKPAEDPRLAIALENQRRLEAEIAALKNQPPPQPVTLGPPPETFGFKDALALVREMNAPLIEMVKELRSQAERQSKELRDEIKEARKSAATGGHGGLEGLRDQLKLLNEIEKEKGGSGGTDLIKFGNMIKDFVKELRETEAASKQPSGGTAQNSGASAPVAWPAGFEAEAAKIGAATDEAGRLGATLGAYEFLVKSGDPFWLRFHALIVEHAKKGEKKEVREYVEAFLDGIKQFVPEPARASALEAFDKHGDKVLALLAAS